MQLYEIFFDGLCIETFTFFMQQQEFTKLGGSILEHHKVVEIIPGERVQVVTSKGSITAMNVVIAAGGWTAGLCSSIGVDLPFKVRTSSTEMIYSKRSSLFHNSHNFVEAHYVCIIVCTFMYTYTPDTHTQLLLQYDAPGKVRVCLCTITYIPKTCQRRIFWNNYYIICFTHWNVHCD